jgi:hypothetical protein
MSKTPAERISLGARAERELAVLDIAIAGVREKLLNAIADSPMEHREQREMCYVAIGVLPEVRQMLVAFINDAAAARHEINAAELMQAAIERRAPREIN